MDLNNTPFFDTLGLSRGSLVNYRKVFFFFFRYFIFSSNTFAFRRNYDFLTTFDINIIIIVTSNFIEDLKLSKRIWILIIKFLFHLPYQRHTYERSLYFFFKEKQGELNFRLNSFFFLQQQQTSNNNSSWTEKEAGMVVSKQVYRNEILSTVRFAHWIIKIVAWNLPVHSWKLKASMHRAIQRAPCPAFFPR